MLKRVLIAVLIAASAPAVGTAATRGAAVSIPTTTGSGVRYPDVAYDASANAYLAVTGKGRAQGAWLSPSGAILKAAFNLTSSTAFQQSPRVLCGEGGNCLVVWHQGDAGTVPMARIVSYDGGFLTPPFALGPLGSNWEMGAGIAYSSAANEFVVTWMSEFNKGNNVSFARVSLAGQLLAKVQLTTGAGYEREPSVAYNPTSGEFVISYAGTFMVNGVEVAYTAAQRVKDGAAVGSRIQLDTAKAEYISNTAFNPATGTVLVTWSRGGMALYARNIFPDGSIGPLMTMSSSAGGYDALDVAYNPISESFLLVTHGSTVEDMAVEITSAGKPSAPFTLTANGGTGNFNPRVVAGTQSPGWLAVTSAGFKTLVGQFVSSTAGAGHCETNCTSGGSTGGGGGGGTTTPPPSISSLAPTPAFPVKAGTAVTWNTIASGGTGLQYQYWLYTGATKTWSVTRPYSSTAAWTWTPAAAGAYAVQVWVRSTGSTANYDAWMGSAYVTVNPSTTSGKVSSVQLSANKTFPSSTGAAVAWTSAATGVTSPGYRVLGVNGTADAWSVARAYSTTSTFAWIPTQPGTYAVQVWARNSGSSAKYEAWASSGKFTISGSGSADLTSVSISASRSFPMPIYTSVTFTGAANGPSPEYQFWLYNATTGDWKVLQDYSTNATCLWIPLQKGTYAVQVWARTAGSTLNYKAWAGSGYFTVN